MTSEVRHAGEETITRAAALIRDGDHVAIAALLDELGASDHAWLLAHLDSEARVGMVAVLTPSDAAELLSDLPEEYAAQVLADLPPAHAALIVTELASNDRADILARVPTQNAEEILARLSRDNANDVRHLLAYSEDVAGGLMVTEVLRFPSGASVTQVVGDLRAGADHYGDYEVQYAYVIDSDDRLLGVLRLRDLLFAKPSQGVTDVMIADPARVLASTPLLALRDFFEEHGFVGAPVVDDSGRLLGVVRRFSVEEALRKQMGRIYRRLSGIVGGDELRSMPLAQRTVRRLSWLSTNIVLNILAASVIAAHQDVLSGAIVLAVFLPMISDMSGCSGNQAVAVSLRELTLGVVRPTEIARVLRKEFSVGVLNGVALGTLLGLAAALWKSSPWLGLVVGSALAINTVIAVTIGGAIPLLLRRYRLDPALASGPLLTTITDMCGFLLVLNFAALVLDRL